MASLDWGRGWGTIGRWLQSFPSKRSSFALSTQCSCLSVGCGIWENMLQSQFRLYFHEFISKKDATAGLFSSSYSVLFSLQVLVNSKEPAVSMSSTRSTNILDNMNKSSRKSTPLNRAANNEKSPVIKPLVPKPKSKQVLLWWPCALCMGRWGASGLPQCG